MLKTKITQHWNTKHRIKFCSTALGEAQQGKREVEGKEEVGMEWLQEEV